MKMPLGKEKGVEGGGGRSSSVSMSRKTQTNLGKEKGRKSADDALEVVLWRVGRGGAVR